MSRSTCPIHPEEFVIGATSLFRKTLKSLLLKEILGKILN
jgi:hypothetical protein